MGVGIVFTILILAISIASDHGQLTTALGVVAIEVHGGEGVSEDTTIRAFFAVDCARICCL